MTSPDEGIAQRLRDFCDPFPPWLDSVTWLAAGLAGGIGAGWLAAHLIWPLRGGPAWQQNVLALVVALYVAAALGARDLPDETPSQFGRRVAALLLHLPYVAIAAVAYLTVCGWAALGLGLYVRADLTAVTPELGPIAIGLALLLLGAVVTTSPRIFGGSRHGLTGTVPGAGSFALRLGGVAVYTALVAAHELRFLHAHGHGWWGIFSPYPIDAGIREGLVLALVLMLTIRWQEQLALAVGEGLFAGKPARSRRWPAVCAPVPLAVELALLESERPADWRLAADYA
ncbi:MAG: hypothetical protein HUU35_13065, partial [Armatimonadetes bacterium]|nr:hypothetical protein [Armatimonadota bacterium]